MNLTVHKEPWHEICRCSPDYYEVEDVHASVIGGGGCYLLIGNYKVYIWACNYRDNFVTGTLANDIGGIDSVNVRYINSVKFKKIFALPVKLD